MAEAGREGRPRCYTGGYVAFARLRGAVTGRERERGEGRVRGAAGRRFKSGTAAPYLGIRSGARKHWRGGRGGITGRHGA